MEYLIHHARHVPLSKQVMVDEDELMDLLDAFRFSLPEEIKKAKWVEQQQERLLSEAHAEASRITDKANERAELAISNQEILNRAERRAAQLMHEAESRHDEIIREAEAYALEQLQQLESHLSRTLATVKRGVEALQSSPTAGENGNGSAMPVEAEATAE
jgi:vacuolar-type H+-ATPase subunit H